MSKHSINYYMRALHRDIGYFVIGLTVIYALSGIVLIYRDTDFLKTEETIIKKLAPNTDLKTLSKKLHIRNLKVQKTEGDLVYFAQGTYDKATGEAVYTKKQLPFILQKMTSLHKKSSKAISHVFSTVFGVLLFFLAISSFWMFKKGSAKFKRGLILAGVGIVAALALLFI